MVARNRFLAESMLNGGQSQQKSPLQPKTVKSQPPKPKYSVPTCHTTLKQMEQARLAREFEQQRKNLNNNNNTEYETGISSLPVDQEQPEIASVDDSDGTGNKGNFVKLKRTLSRTTSVGKLVNNFENGNGLLQDQEQPQLVNPFLGFNSNSNPPDFGGFNPAIQQAVAFSYIKPKPPLAAKPSLRHTVSFFQLTFTWSCHLMLALYGNLDCEVFRIGIPNGRYLNPGNLFFKMYF